MNWFQSLYEEVSTGGIAQKVYARTNCAIELEDCFNSCRAAFNFIFVVQFG